MTVAGMFVSEGLQEQFAVSAVQRLTDQEVEIARREYAEDGYFILRNKVSQEGLSQLHASLSGEFDRAVRSGTLFAGGGTLSGHLNCFPGAGARFAYDSLEHTGVLDLARNLHPKMQRMPYVGCNFNLPGSYTQHWHTDRPFTRDFMIINIAVVDTSIENGATDMIPGTHKRFYKYTRFVLERCERNSRRVLMKRGDVMVRNSNVWHRGMKNLTSNPRPMLAFTWEDGGNTDADPFNAYGGQIRFLPNWFKLTPMGRMRERLFVKVPATYTALRLARSLVDSQY